METKKKFVINAAFYGIIIALVAAGYQYILPILTPFIVGFCVASVVRVPLRHVKLKDPRHRRWLAAAFCAVFYVLIAGLLVLLSWKIVDSVSEFAVALPGLFDTVLLPFCTEVAHRIEEMLNPIDSELADWIIELGKTVTQSLGQFATNLSASLVKWVANSAVSIPNLIIQIVLTVVSSFYIASDYRKVINFLMRLIPSSKRGLTVEALRYAQKAVVVYIKSYSIIFGVTFLELCIGLSLLKIPYAGAIAFGIAVFDLLPVLGTGGILLPWAVILVLMGNFPLAIGILVLYIVITAVRNALEPRIVGNQIGLHPLATLVAMILGLNLMGLLGMLLFPISLVAITNLRKKAQETSSPESQDAGS